MPKLSALSASALQRQMFFQYNYLCSSSIHFTTCGVAASSAPAKGKKRGMMNCRCVNVNGKSIDVNQKSVLHEYFHSSSTTNNVSNFSDCKAHFRSHLVVHYIIFHINKYLYF